jgi:ABC-type transport system substrate-binding protein
MARSDTRSPFERPITRRRFVGSSLGLLSVGGLLAACGGGEDDEAAPPAATGAAPTETIASGGAARTGGTLVYTASSPSAGFDPHKYWNSLAFNGGALAVFDRLLTVTQDGTLEPSLLSELPEVNADGTLYTLRLRPGVQFHHGRGLTAADVKYSLERLVNPATGSEGAGLYTAIPILGMADVQNERAEELAGISVVDDETLTIELEQADSALLFVLSYTFASIVPRDVIEEIGDDFNFAPVGTGPFVMAEAVPDRGYTLERNENYWNPELPYVDRVTAEFGVDPELAVLRIQDGQQDLMEEEIPSGSLDQLRNDPSLEDQVVIDTANNIFYITLSLKHEALSDLRVRQAIAMAVDKERLVRTLKGLGQPATGGLFSPLSPYFQDGIAHPFDVEGAKQLLAETPFADGFEVTFWATNTTPWIEIAQTTQQDLAQLGITVDVQAQPREAWLAEIVKNPPGITENQWELPYPHGSYVIDSAFTQAAIDAGCCNFSNYVSEDFEELVRAAHRATDVDEVAELYRQMDAVVVRDEALWVPLFYPTYSAFVSSRLGGYSVPGSPGPNAKLFAQYWIEEA